jgi:hypothetical protein
MDRVWSDRSITALKLLVALLSLGPFITNGFSVCTTTGRQGTSVSGPIVSFLGMSRDWIDEVEYLDDDPIDDGPPVSPDMKYLPRNVMRQNKNFVAMRQAGTVLAMSADTPALVSPLFVSSTKHVYVYRRKGDNQRHLCARAKI